MQLQKIKDYIQAYTAWLATPAAATNLPYWETQANWQQHWDLDAPDLPAMYDRALNNLTNRRLWSRQAYDPKQMMLAFWEMDRHFVHSSFVDLFDEARGVHGRADRFVFFCDQLLPLYQEQHPRAKANSHYHGDDYAMVSLYLSCQYPLLYAPYSPAALRTLLQRLGAPNVPPAGDFERHVKVIRTLYTLLTKDEVVLERHRARLRPVDYDGDSLLLAFDFAAFVVET